MSFFRWLNPLNWFRRSKPAPAPSTPAPAAETKPSKPAPKKAAKKSAAKTGEYQPQCSALTAAGDQCRNSARAGSKYCGSHKGYQPPSKASVQSRKDTLPVHEVAKDTIPGKGTKGTTKAGKQAQCAAVTAAGKQCQNSSRDGSKYCGRHKGYRYAGPDAKVKKTDTAPRVPKAADTKPSTRRSQVSHGDYKLFQKGNRYFFSKKSQAEAKKDGATAVYKIPAGRTVVKTPNGLPVLKKK